MQSQGDVSDTGMSCQCESGKEFFLLSPRALDHKCLGLGVDTDKAVREGREQGCENRSWLINMGAQQAFGSTIKKQFCCTVQDRQDNRV